MPTAACCSPRATTVAPLFAHDEQGVRDWYIRRRSSGAILFGVSVARPIGEHMYLVQVGQDLAHRDVIIDDVVSRSFRASPGSPSRSCCCCC